MTEPPFVGRWLRSYEEVLEGAQVYRAEAYPLPPARGRASVEIDADGGFVDAPLGPTEGSAPTVGRWTSVDGRRGTATFSERPPLAFRVEDLVDGSTRLVVRRGCAG